MESKNLASIIQSNLTAEMLALLDKIRQTATRENIKLYLTGGLPRDLLLGKSGLDMDIAVEGDAIALGQRLAVGAKAKLTIHRRFGTANLKWPALSLDLTSTRRESYLSPGALPTVEPGNIKSDLLRRDFTVNAMAVSLNTDDYGDLIDPCGGLADLKIGLIRVLHNKSFKDDATRIWRALRYEQRLAFNIEAATLRLLQRDIPMLDTISGDRLRYELECVFREELPEKVFTRASNLGVLARLHPELKAHAWLAEKFALARKACHPARPSEAIYLGLLAYRLDGAAVKSLDTKLCLPKAISQVLQHSLELRNRLRELSQPDLKPSAIYHILHGYTPAALTVNLVAGDLPQARRNIEFYLNKLRHVRAPRSGADLLKTGIPQGPRIKEKLQQLLDAHLDEQVTPPS